MLYGHGDDRYKYNQKITADFSSNTWFEGPPPDLISHLHTKIANIVIYPEPGADSLKNKIADFYSVSPGNVSVANGSTEIFYLIAQAFRKSKSTIIYPAFAEYEDACKVHEHLISHVSNQNSWVHHKYSKQLVWFGNPNNPDGKIVSVSEIRQLLENNQETIFVIDEAYGDLSFGFESAISLIKEFSNLIVTGSFTKTFVIPGLRLGYMLAAEDIIRKIDKVKMPWTVNSLALEAGKYIIDHYVDLLPDIKKIEKYTLAFQQQLKEINGIKVYPTQCNYCLLKVKGKSSADLKDFLMRNHGILIRDASNFRGLDTSFFRVSTQSENDNDLLVKSIKKWMSVN